VAAEAEAELEVVAAALVERVLVPGAQVLAGRAQARVEEPVA
jgi:hypothetical protein